MNDLYLIGNGFDLAHGLKTSYNDFLLWYLKYAIRKSESYVYEDNLLKIDGRESTLVVDSYTSTTRLLEHCKHSNITINYMHRFFKDLLENSQRYKWVDIEYEYYLALIDIYIGYERNNITKSEHFNNQVIAWNTCFEYIKKILCEYLLTIEITTKQENRHIESILLEGNGPDCLAKGEKIYLYFNYTSTMELYSRNFLAKNNQIYIHGKLRNLNNPIIFGYGDEMDPHYERIENLNNNEFLKNIKSFGYFRTDNYQKVIRFIEGEGREFTVKVLGHSCGLSDRILLNTIFEHPNCKAIKIYFYEKSETENDYFEKTQEISRHFKASGKGNMRNKIVPFSQSVPLLPFVPNN